MTSSNDLDRSLTHLFEEEAAAPAPDGILEAVALDIGGRTPRPAWRAGLSSGREHSADARVAARSLGAIALVVLAILALAIAAAGSRPSRPLPSPFAADRSPSAAVASPSGRPVPSSIAILPGEPWIVYESTVPGGEALFLIRSDGTDGHRFLGDIGSALLHPDWSPDGAEIAFEKMDGTVQIWAADAGGANPHALVTCLADPCKQVIYPAWSPDGTKVAYTRFDHNDALGDSGDRFSIEVLTVGTGERVVAAQAPGVGATYTEYIYPRWSPDGRHLAFTINHYGNPPHDPILDSAIATVRSDGSDRDRPTVITDPKLFASHADWSPTTDLLVFTTYDLAYFQNTDQASNLYTVRSDGAKLTPLTTFAGGDMRATTPSWTPDGRQIVFSAVGGSRQVALIDARGGRIRLVGGTPATDARLRPGASP